jgi:fructoselysine-6-P-deglycase FrlB-like protein
MVNSLAEIPRVLAALLQKEKEFGAFIRATGWGDGPLYFVGSEASFPACLTGAAAFESLVGVPTMARVEAEFLAYSLDALRPRALVFLVPPVEDAKEMAGAARTLRLRGARLVTLGGEGQNPLAGAADGVVPLPEGAVATSSYSSALARHAALAYLALVAARILMPPQEERRRTEAEFEGLPREAERTLAQSSDAIRVFGEEVKKASRLVVAGGGRFFPVAVEAARGLEKDAGIEAIALDVARAAPPRLLPEARAIVLSCSRCRVRAQVHRWAAQVSKSGGVVLSLTDAADRGLCESSQAVLLLPALGEAAASILQLAVAGALARPAGRGRRKAVAK